MKKLRLFKQQVAAGAATAIAPLPAENATLYEQIEDRRQRRPATEALFTTMQGVGVAALGAVLSVAAFVEGSTGVAEGGLMIAAAGGAVALEAVLDLRSIGAQELAQVPVQPPHA